MVCPLLNGNRCSVHRLKPFVCALAPIGRFVVAKSALETNLGKPNEINYMFTNFSCASLKRKQTVRAWLEMFNIPINDKFYIEWNKLAFTVSTIIRNNEGKKGFGEKNMDVLWGAIFSPLYADYDTKKEFFPQFEDNAAKLYLFFERIEQMGEMMSTE
jgi:hypothetical protein